MNDTVGGQASLDLRAPAYELAFVEAGRALDAQERAVNELRSRAGILIAAAAIATSFFGGGAVTGERGGLGVSIAVGAFALVGVAVLAADDRRDGRQAKAEAEPVGARRRDTAVRARSASGAFG